MKSILFVAVLLFSATGCYAQTKDPVKASIDTIARRYLSHRHAAGLVIGIYRQGSDTPEIYPYGVVNKRSKIKPKASTIFKLGSVGKTFTATALAWYVVNKSQTLQLNNTIDQFFSASTKLPFWTSKKTMGDTVRITLLNLAMHYSSLPDTQPNHVRPPNYSIDSLLSFIGSDNPKWNMRPLAIRPGTKWIYSNTAFGLLGVILGNVSGMSYQQLLDTVFCNELNMPDTKISLNKEQLSRLATGYQKGQPVKYTLTSPAFYGAGGNYSTMNDMVKYLAWNMGLTKSGLNNLLDTLHMARDTTFKSTGWQGLAWQIGLLNPPSSSQKYIAKDGATTGYSSFICFVPETKTGVVVMGNNFDKGMGFDAIGVEVLRVLNSVK